ncbi:MAG: hypothetical protein EBX40_00400 [Gammaproteobacteria bacterium]|nr:hypothetical protein [Gammaproteobacteria bacterium]
MSGNSPDTGTIYYYDDKIIVTKNMVTLGNPYNQAVFGLLMGGILFSQDWTLTGSTIFLGSIGICWLAIRGSSRPFVELKFGGLNNQMLYMKKMDEAEALAVAIKMAMHDLNTPPEPGQAVYKPIFPAPADPVSRNPIFSRN